jgi:hypothetical protein
MICAASESLFDADINSNPLVLELGSGLGRCGILLAKIMYLRHCYGQCIMTDGESDLVNQLQHNCIVNHVITDYPSSPTVQCECTQLWWGDTPSLHSLVASNPDGCDFIFGITLK